MANYDDKRDVARVICCVAHIDQTCIGKTAKQIRTDIDVQRLSKEQLQGVPSTPFVRPGESLDHVDSDEGGERHYLLPQQSAEETLVTFSSYIDVRSTNITLQPEQCLWTGHAKFAVRLLSQFAEKPHKVVRGEAA